MKRTTLCLLLTLLTLVPADAEDRLAQIERQLREAPVQEKIYLHMDNTCYFKGDTIWYKAYVVRADSLTYSDMSHITYVELLSPDGMVVERQQLITSPQGWTCGNFILEDSLYSGYYEMRAYTRWMLNFCVTHRKYNYYDRLAFYNQQMADDFYRDYGTLYSRVFPVYERPSSPGEYDEKYVVSRPKMRLDKVQKKQLHVNFYPEGGHLIAGTCSRVAFEAYDEEGQQVEAEGQLNGIAIGTEHEGRGTFMLDVPEKGSLKADFHYNDKDYRFSLPDIERKGCCLTLHDSADHVTAELTMKSVASQDCAVAVLCRGVLKAFQRIRPDSEGRCTVNIDKAALPTGVCDLIVIDADGQPMADRLFFVNHHDYVKGGIRVRGLKSDYQPLELASITLQTPPGTHHVSVAKRDDVTDEPTYDTGNILTDLLLSSELQGFVPHPDYYFESDDSTHRRHLDLLLMVQGWRRYDYRELTDTASLRYEPEKALSVAGRVYPYHSDEDFSEIHPDNLHLMIKDTEAGPGQEKDFMGNESSKDTNEEGTEADGENTYIPFLDAMQEQQEENASEEENYAALGYGAFKEATPVNERELMVYDDNDRYKHKFGYLKKEVTLTAELVYGSRVADVELQTHDGGQFEFYVPPYYGDGTLFLMAYNTDIKSSSLSKYRRKGWADEGAAAKYYVKRDLFFPIFPKKYSYYQNHHPKDTTQQAVIERISSMDRTLQNVNVKSRRRRGLHAVDYSKPAYVIDTQELYNLGVDYGLSRGFYQPRYLPQTVARVLFGTINVYGPYSQFNVQARVDGYTYYRDFFSRIVLHNPNTTDEHIISQLKLKRQDQLWVYSDLEPRNPVQSCQHSDYQADIYLDCKLVPDNGIRPTYRDRRFVLHGFYAPDHFYHRNYSGTPTPAKVKDHRRTLYWNPNASLDAEGRFTAIFYNNNKRTQIRVSVVGLTSDGQPVYY